LIRVVIVARSEGVAADLAELLAEENRLDVSTVLHPAGEPDVLLLKGMDAPPEWHDIPALVLGEEPGSVSGPVSGLVRAHLPDSTTAEQLIAALVAVANGLIVTSSEEEMRSGQRRHTELPPLLEPLTPRELQVLRYLADGLSNKEIAARLSLSDHTVKFHVASILGKLGAASRAEAVAQGLRRGLVPI
jgi:DNA-binding NarL/FixJ family response regulator